MSWQDISTAPKDGRDILAIDNGVCRVVRWDPKVKKWRANIYAFITLEPKLWQPVPELPKTAHLTRQAPDDLGLPSDSQAPS